MKYHAYRPTKLNGIVDQIWEMEIPSACRYTILPEGKVQLLFPLHQSLDISARKISNAENPMRNFSSFLSGLHTKPLKLNFERFHTFGIQMKPIAAKAIFGLPLYEIRDYFVEGDIVLKNIRMMEDRLQTRSSFQERALWFENFLLKLITETPDLHLAIRLDKAIHQFISQKKDKDQSIEDMLGYSRTQTFRLFNTWFGTSPHSYLQLCQFIRSLDSLHRSPARLGDIAFANGFYDQAHFIRTFRKFADMSPGAYRKQMTDFPGQLFS